MWWRSFLFVVFFIVYCALIWEMYFYLRSIPGFSVNKSFSCSVFKCFFCLRGLERNKSMKGDLYRSHTKIHFSISGGNSRQFSTLITTAWSWLLYSNIGRSLQFELWGIRGTSCQGGAGAASDHWRDAEIKPEAIEEDNRFTGGSRHDQIAIEKLTFFSINRKKVRPWSLASPAWEKNTQPIGICKVMEFFLIKFSWWWTQKIFLKNKCLAGNFSVFRLSSKLVKNITLFTRHRLYHIFCNGWQFTLCIHTGVIGQQNKSYLFLWIHDHCWRHAEGATGLPYLFSCLLFFHVPMITSCIIKKIAMQNRMGFSHPRILFVHVPN